MFDHHQLNGASIDALAVTYEVPAGTRHLVIGLAAKVTEPRVERSALVAYRLIDDLGNVAVPNSQYYRSTRVGFFFYLDVERREVASATTTVVTIAVPPAVKTIELKGHSWAPGSTTTLDELVVVPVADERIVVEGEEAVPRWLLEKVDPALKKRWAQRFTDRGPIEPGNNHLQTEWSIAKEIVGEPLGLDANRDAYRSHGPREAHRFKVALICDEFTFNSFSPEFDYVVLEPENWRERIEAFEPDFVFCESTWSGVDSVRRPWRGQVYASVKFPRENRGALISILAYCKERSIPTVFWNKEDPTHFHDRVNDFVSTASRFDYIFTTAEEMLDEYLKFVPQDRLGVLQFAAQPREFNPLSVAQREHRAVFAGAWYDIHENRSESMRQGLDSILSANIPLLIHDRNLRGPSQETNFPPPYNKFVLPAISHKATARLYRSSEIGLNFNTVTDSGTMFARRVFELAASGTFVVSDYSAGIERIYGDKVHFYDRGAASLSDLSGADIADRSRGALRETMLRHTYRQRFEQILKLLGLRFTSSRPSPTMMAVVGSAESAHRAIATYRARKADFSKLLLVVSREVRSSRTGRYFAEFNGSDVNVVSEELIATERVPPTNFLSTPDVIWVDPLGLPSSRDIETMMLHGEYTRHPVVVHDRQDTVMSAGPAGVGMRLAAIDVVSALTSRQSVRPILKAAR